MTLMQPANANRASAAAGPQGETASPAFHETVTLQRLIAPISEEEFRARYWQRKPLIIHRGDPNYYSGLFTLQDFDERTVGGRGYVKTAEATSKSHVKHHGTAAAALERVLTDMRDGHTLILDSRHHYEPQLGLMFGTFSPANTAHFQN